MPIPILMPALSPTMEEGTLAKWMVKEGDTVKSGDIIAEIETDKATMEVEAVDEGVVGKLLVAEGTEEVKVNVAIAVLLADGEDASALDQFDAAAGPAPSASAPPAEAPAAPAAAPQPSAAPQPTPAPAGTAANTGARVIATPLAKRMAAQAGLDLASVAGSGPNGRIVKQDVETAIAGGGAKIIPIRPAASQTAPVVAPGAAYEDIPATGMRKTIARRLTEAKRDVPHYYLTVDCEIDSLLASRKKLNDMSPQGDGAYKISVNDFVIRACAMALKQVPEANSSWMGDSVRQHAHADIGMAVAIDGGLITPIIWQAETKGLKQIAEEAKDLAQRARNRKLKPQEYEGGSFSISNLGMFGIKHFTAVINPPHAAILAVGSGEQRPVVKNGELTVATIMTCTMSCDHRVLDGAEGARFLQVFKSCIEDPVTMLL